MGNLQTARELVSIPISYFTTKQKHKGYVAVYSQTLAEVEIHEGNYGEARRIIDNHAEILRLPGRSTYSVGVDKRLGLIALLEGNIQTALEYFTECLITLQEVSSTGLLLEVIMRIAYVLITNKQWEEATILLSAADRYHGQFAITISLVDQPIYEKYLSMVEENLDEAIFEECWEEGAEMTLEETMNFASDIELE